MADTDNTAGVQFHVSPELDYVYRDVVNIYVGPGDVVLELGNRHRSMPEHVTIANRIVLSIANAYDLQKRLGEALTDAQEKLREQVRQQQGAQGGKSQG